MAFFLSDWAKDTHNWGEGANLGVVAGLTSLNRFNCWPKAPIYIFSAPSTATRSGRTVWLGEDGLKPGPTLLVPLRLLRAQGERYG